MLIKYAILLKQIMVSSVWIIFEYSNMKKMLRTEYLLEKIQLFKFKSWHSGYKYLTAYKEGKKYFIKIDSTYKVIKNEIISTNILREINKINFPQINYYGQFKKDEFIIMEYIEGESLQDIIDCGKYKDRVYEIISQLNIILTCLHNKNIIHRDIKPNNFIVNIMEDNTLNLTLIDFTFCISLENNQIKEIKQLNKNIKVLEGLGEQYKLSKNIWDDAYSISKIIEALNEGIDIDEYNSIKAKIGRKVYYLGDKWNE